MVNTNRTKLISTTFTPGTSYAAGNNFGGKLTFSTGNSNQTVFVRRAIVVGSASTLTASANLGLYVFNANPATTFTDGSAVTWTSSDNSKICFNIPISGVAASFGQIANQYTAGAAATNPTAQAQSVTTDSSGNIYAILQAGGTWTMTTPAAFTVTLEVEF